MAQVSSRLSESTVFKISGGSLLGPILAPFWDPFGTPRGPLYSPKEPKGGQEGVQEGVPKRDRFLTPLFEPKGTPKWEDFFSVPHLSCDPSPPLSDL